MALPPTHRPAGFAPATALGLCYMALAFFGTWAGPLPLSSLVTLPLQAPACLRTIHWLPSFLAGSLAEV
jgi:hypothetical protein